MQLQMSLGMRLKKWTAIAVGCVIPVLIAGCNGGTGGGGFNQPTQNGSFAGASANLGANRNGVLSLKTFTDNSVSGTLVVTATAIVAKKSVTSNALVTLPTGTYNFTGTRTGNSFSGTGTIPGTNTTFTISGTLSTTATAGSFSLTGTFNGEAFNFPGTISISGGGGGGGGNGAFTFSGNSSNANTASFSANAGGGTLITFGSERLLTATFASATSATNLRNVTISVSKGSQLAVGDTFPLADNEDPTVGQGVVIYGEGVPTNKAWVSNGGQVKITAISGSNYTLQLTNATMIVAPLAGPGQTNTATGTFTLNGSGNALIP